MTKVSVVIPVLNGEKYIGRAIESVLKQDYKDIELVVCNGGSTDKTQEIAEGYGIKIVQGKLGIMPNWKEALKAVTGSYVKMLCHDDTLREDCIREQASILDKHPEVSLVSCPRQYIDKDDNKTSVLGMPPDGVDILCSGQEAAEVMLFHGNVIGETTCTMFRNTHLAFPHDLNWLVDMYMWMQLFGRGSYYYIAKPMANIRQHPEQDSYRVLKDPHYHEKEASDKNHIRRVYERFVK